MRLHKQSLLRRIKELDDLESSGVWNNQLKEERFKVKSKLEKIFLKEERAFRMKSKFTWAKEGATNTKLFHSLVNLRKAKDVITKLELEYGSLVDKNKYIVLEITGFFQSLYKLEGLSFWGIHGIEWQPIASHLVEWLERPFEEEVKKAIYECDGNRAPGPNGFILALFQSH